MSVLGCDKSLLITGAAFFYLCIMSISLSVNQSVIYYAKNTKFVQIAIRTICNAARNLKHENVSCLIPEKKSSMNMTLNLRAC